MRAAVAAIAINRSEGVPVPLAPNSLHLAVKVRMLVNSQAMCQFSQRGEHRIPPYLLKGAPLPKWKFGVLLVPNRGRLCSATDDVCYLVFSTSSSKS